MARPTGSAKSALPSLTPLPRPHCHVALGNVQRSICRPDRSLARTPEGSCPSEGAPWALGGLGEGRGPERSCSEQAYLGQCQLLTCLLCHFIKETCSQVRCGHTHRLGLPKAEPGPGRLPGHVVTRPLHLSLGMLSLGHGEEEADADQGEQVRQVPHEPLPHMIHPPCNPSRQARGRGGSC